MAAILLAILVIVPHTEFVIKFEQEIDGSNPYMKFGRNPIKNDLVRLTTTADTDRQQPFCQTKPIFELVTTKADIDKWRPFCLPSWLSDV